MNERRDDMKGCFSPPVPLYSTGTAGRGKGYSSKGSASGKGGSGEVTASSPSPALLTANLKNSRTLEEVFCTVAAHEKRFNHIHLSACWSALGNLANWADGLWVLEHAPVLNLLVQRTMHIASTSSEIRARELANIAHGAAKSGQAGTMSALMTTLARSIERRVADCNAQELANVAWAFAKAATPDTELFAVLARACEVQLSSFKAQELANTAWGFATAGHTDTRLFAALARAAEARLADFSVQGLSNTAWAFAKAGHDDAPLFRALAVAARQRLPEFNAQDLAHTAWAFAKAGALEAELAEALALAAESELGRFSAQGLANLVWAFAKAGHLGGRLFAACATAIRGRVAEFNSQDLANTAWAFARACHTDAELFGALGGAAKHCLTDFNTQDLINTAWAFAKLGVPDAALFSSVARSLASQQRLGTLSVQQVANIAWAFAKAEAIDTGLFDALARSAAQRASDFSAEDLANVAWAFANAGLLEGRLFASLAAAAEGRLHEFADEALDNAEWAFARAGQHKVAKALRMRRKRAASAMEGDATSGGGSGGGGLGGGGGGSGGGVSACGPVVVAGGGIGGAAVAVALQSHGFDVMVLEADSSFEARKQGYGLTIQRQDATQAMGLQLGRDDAPSTSHYTFSAEGHILGFYGEAFGEKSRGRREADDSGRFVHIPRQTLRQRIVERLRPGTIRWGAKLKSFACWIDDPERRQHPSTPANGPFANGVTVTLADGSTLDAALLVGSDGIFSTVRRQLALPRDRLHYVGLLVVLGIHEGPLSLPLAERRIFETVDGTSRIYAMPFTTSATMWQLSFPYPEAAGKALVRDAAALKAEIMTRCTKWHEPVPSLLRDTPLEAMSGYPVYDRDLLEPSALRPPLGSASATAAAAPVPQRRVTLIGDAAHPMTPFRAQGANMAIADAVLLAETLAANIRRHGPHAGIDAALPAFEVEMCSRSSRAVVGSREKARELHSSLALQPARKVQRDAGLDMPKVIRLLRESGIGAHSAADARGLDAVVADVIERSGEGGGGGGALGPGSRLRTPDHAPMEVAALSPAGRGERGELKRRRRMAARLGFKSRWWRESMCNMLAAAAEGGMLRKQLQRAVLGLYLHRFSQLHADADADRQWWEAHPAELKMLFRKHLRRAQRRGWLSTQKTAGLCLVSVHGAAQAAH